MLPILQADEIKHSIIEYLKATFNFSEPQKVQAFEDLLLDKKEGLFKGPYLQARLPFQVFGKKTGEEKALRDCIEIRPPFDPYQHQYEAFKRLSVRNGHEPEPVILTTGTGSGKTESFLFPLLDYCWQQREQKGVKAIILYPMNALATDQARRLAQEIYNFKNVKGEYILRDTIRAGLFIGEGRSKTKTRHTRMGTDHIIEDRRIIIKSPPDILLTNFKMLDFALMKAAYNSLWQYNYKNNGILRFLVLDELHTYDGAKGSDVANLIRRLKLKLDLPKNYIVPIGTSATMSGGEEAKQELVNFFSQIFGVKISHKAVIEEERLSVLDFFDKETIEPNVSGKQIEDCQFLEKDDYNSYIQRQLGFWSYEGLNPVDLGVELKKNEYLEELLTIMDGTIQKVEELIALWAKKCKLAEKYKEEQVNLLFYSLLALVSHAKLASGSKTFPFIYTQLSYWNRTLTRVVQKVQEKSEFDWEVESNEQSKIAALPPYYCRDCGGSGWIAIRKTNAEHLEKNISQTRQLFISDKFNKNIYFLSLMGEQSLPDIIAPDYQPSDTSFQIYLNPKTLNIFDKREEDTLKVVALQRANDLSIEKVCPHCNASNSLALIGTGLPTLESIAVAQVLASATDNSTNQERKLLAFTNGVQDAAHQAGFIENRNYRFGMRHAIQKVLNDANQVLTLEELFERFEIYWKKNAKDTSKKIDSYLYKFFPPDCESRINIEDYRNKKGQFSQTFIKEFSRRLSWEIWSEFSYNAAIGRTLEKTGASAVAFDAAMMEQVYEQMKDWLQQNRLGDRMPKERFLKFLNGFLHRLRRRGGVDHPYLKKFRSEKSNYYLITQNVNKSFFMMKNFGKRTRLPKFITLKKGQFTNVFDVLQVTTNQNWYSTYFLKSFDLIATEETSLINDFYETLINYLDVNDLLNRKIATGIINYGLNLSDIKITNQAQGFKCSKCEETLYVGLESATLTNEMPCLKYRCSGHYQPMVTSIYDYYRMVYNRGKSLRIFANDHTGLIDRDKREELEKDFKERPKSNSTNVLVATSTLEMGIDIGDLNVTFNSSLPPETSNYLQRVGRAGRKSGTSLILNIAGRAEHDLYYFKEPMSMMDGIVRTPSCFLEAKDILKRHFMAFCFDNWSSQDPVGNRIPSKIRILGIKNISIRDKRFIFNQIANFVSQQKQKLFERFIDQYTDWISENSDALIELQEELLSGFFLKRLTDLHQTLLNEIKYYEEKRSEVKKLLKKMPETGLETEILKNEIRALSSALRNINGRNTIEYLNNMGILPNYAFPETGILLNAQIRRKKEVDGKVEFENIEFGDIVRPSSSAISELAPANIFYSQGHKLEAQGLEILSNDEYEEYRFCSNCPEMIREVDIATQQSYCPTCGDSSWSSTKNRKTLVKLRTVLSINDKDKAKITDSREERDRKFYHKSFHIQTQQKTSKGAWVLKQIPFGIEFFSKTRYFEINTGIKNEAGKQIDINGTKHPELGFIVCKKCGKATERKLSAKDLEKHPKRAYHFPYCSNRQELYEDKVDAFFEEIYIYRQFDTEALKILLPVQDFRTIEKVALFKAGLYLGLKEYYKGQPDHIRIQEYVEYNEEKKRKERFLVMYETIPGGTGYLSKLFDRKRFSELLKSAYDRIRYCNCKDEGKDGCYHCIYTYGNQYERNILSRIEAEKLFQEIIEKAEEWKKVDSLKGIEDFANLEESALEFLFVELLQLQCHNNPNWTFQEKIQDGIKTYRIQLSKGTDRVEYALLPQNLERYLSGLAYKTRPDFLLKAVAWYKKGVSVSMDEIATIKPIALYLDGYKYHASKDYPRVPADITRRNAIVESEQYHQWTLTWNDLELAKTNDMDTLAKLVKSEEIEQKLFARHPLFKDKGLEKLVYTNNFIRFFQVLLSPLETLSIEHYAKLTLLACTKELLGKCYREEDVEQFILHQDIKEEFAIRNNPKLFVHSDNIHFSSEMGIQVFMEFLKFDSKGYAYYNNELEEWEQDNWQFFWEIYNLTQFLGITALYKKERVEIQFSREEDLAEILENFDPNLHLIVEQLVKANIEFNKEFDFDLMEEDEIIASAHLGSQEKKFVIQPYDEESAKIFEAKGYQIIDKMKFDINKL